ncbi:hypothetical protein M8C21_005723, partial [Ambrosia artemisiifolia]
MKITSESTPATPTTRRPHPAHTPSSPPLKTLTRPETTNIFSPSTTSPSQPFIHLLQHYRKSLSRSGSFVEAIDYSIIQLHFDDQLHKLIVFGPHLEVGSSTVMLIARKLAHNIQIPSLARDQR